MINRSAVTVCAKQPFLDWLMEIPDPVQPDLTLEQINEEPNVYLLPAYDTDDDKAELIEQFHDAIFETELDEWCTDESAWPQNRDFELFMEWFTVTFHSVVEDMVDAPLLEEEE